MNEAPSQGLRERKKAATEEALHAVALRLFAQRGYRATTVADIAEAANVSERTFFRYFRSKEDVALYDVAVLMGELGRAIRARPRDEAPLTAVREAFLAVAEGAEAPKLALLYSGPPVSWSGPLAPSRVRLLTRLEASVIDALLARHDGAETDEETRYAAEVAARVGLAAVRSALIRFHELGGSEAQPAHRFIELVRQAFDLLDRGGGVAAPGRRA
jgi:AcrR family transcriptional regulator